MGRMGSAAIPTMGPVCATHTDCDGDGDETTNPCMPGRCSQCETTDIANPCTTELVNGFVSPLDKYTALGNEQCSIDADCDEDNDPSTPSNNKCVPLSTMYNTRHDG